MPPLPINPVVDGSHRVPVVAAIGAAVGCIVDAAHEQGVAAALDRWGSGGLDRTSLEQILSYCAEQRCKADDATCAGCRLRTEKLGLKSLADFVAPRGTKLAIWQERSDASNASMRRAPLFPSSNRFHDASTPQPKGVTRPRPVTTTRRMLGPRLSNR